MGKEKRLREARSFAREGITLEEYNERLNREAKPEPLPHGGVLRMPMSTPPEETAKAMRAILDRGERILSGEELIAADVEPIPGAKVEVFELWDADTDEYLFIWRIPCRQRVVQ